MNAIIVDDEVAGAGSLKSLLAIYCPEVNVVAVAHSALQGLQEIKNHQIDLLFLDIEMPGGNGFDLLDWVGDYDFAVIFTTAYDHYAIKAIRFSAIDYLLKPVDESELIKAVNKVKNRMVQKISASPTMQELKENTRNAGNGVRKLTVAALDSVFFIEIDDIIQVIAETNYSRIILKNGEKILASKTLKDFEDLLEEEGFFRAHKSHLINLKYIKKLAKGDGGYIVMSDGTEVSLAQRRKADLMKILGV